MCESVDWIFLRDRQDYEKFFLCANYGQSIYVQIDDISLLHVTNNRGK